MKPLSHIQTKVHTSAQVNDKTSSLIKTLAQHAVFLLLIANMNFDISRSLLGSNLEFSSRIWSFQRQCWMNSLLNARTELLKIQTTLLPKLNSCCGTRIDCCELVELTKLERCLCVAYWQGYDAAWQEDLTAWLARKLMPRIFGRQYGSWLAGNREQDQ